MIFNILSNKTNSIILLEILILYDVYPFKIVHTSIDFLIFTNKKHILLRMSINNMCFISNLVP